MAVLLTAYVLAAVICKWADIHGEENQGPVQLQENIPSDKQLYAVTVDTGFRSRPVMTAKVGHLKRQPQSYTFSLIKYLMWINKH